MKINICISKIRYTKIPCKDTEIKKMIVSDESYLLYQGHREDCIESNDCFLYNLKTISST